MRNLRTTIQELFRTYSFSVVSLAGFGVNFIQSFIFAAILDKEFFGELFLVFSLFSTFSYLFVFGLDTAVFRFFFDANFADKANLKFSIFITWLRYSAVLMVVLLIAGYVAIELLDYRFVVFHTEYIALVVSGLFFSFGLIAQQYFVAAKNVWMYAVVSVGSRLLVLGANIAAILLFEPSVSSVVYSYFIATSIFFVAAIFVFGLVRWFKPADGLLTEVRTFSLPLIVNAVFSIGFTNGYRVLISIWMTFANLAVYGIISQISMAYYIGLTALILPYNARAYKFLNEHPDMKNVPELRAKCMQFGLSGVAAMLVVAYVFLMYFKDGIYLEGYRFLPILLVGQFFFVMYSHEYTVLSFLKRTRQITYATLTGILLILGTFWFFVSSWQLLGACLAILIGYFGQYSAAVTFKRNSIRVA